MGQPSRRQMLKNLAAAMIALSLPEQGLSVTDVDEKMYTRLIPATREPLPVVGCGTYRTFDVGATPAQRAPLLEVLKVLFGAGGSVIDTSPMYGAAEHVVGDLLPSWAQEIDCQSWAQLLLKFVLSHPAVTCAIPGTGRPEHMLDNIGAGFGRMPDATLRARMIDYCKTN